MKLGGGSLTEFYLIYCYLSGYLIRLEGGRAGGGEIIFGGILLWLTAFELLVCFLLLNAYLLPKAGQPKQDYYKSPY